MKTIAGVVAFVFLLTGLGVWFVLSKLDNKVEKTDKVVQVRIMRPPDTPPPPPPPPPPPEEDVDVPEPEPTPDIEEPNLEAAADPGPSGPIGNDAFGQQRGSGGSGSGQPYSLQAHQQWYAQKARDRIRALLAQRSGIKQGTYKIPIRLWIDGDGRLERFELLRSTGDPGIDKEIEAALSSFGQMTERRPDQLPPFRIRVEYKV